MILNQWREVAGHVRLSYQIYIFKCYHFPHRNKIIEQVFFSHAYITMFWSFWPLTSLHEWNNSLLRWKYWWVRNKYILVLKYYTLHIKIDNMLAKYVQTSRVTTCQEFAYKCLMLSEVQNKYVKLLSGTGISSHIIQNSFTVNMLLY